MWDRFQAQSGGVLVVGHGTRVATGVAQLLDLAFQLQKLFGEIPVEPGFLELAEPTIPQALNRLRLRNVNGVVVLPILLFEAAHARSDIPDAVQVAADSLGLSIVAQSPPLGTAQAALSLSEFRFVEALRCTNALGCLMAGACDRVAECFDSEQKLRVDQSLREPSKIGLAMVGRGTSDLVALEQMRRFTALRVSGSNTQVSWVQTGFFAGGAPTVDQLLMNALGSECDTLVVQPHLLFEGELVRQLREKVKECQRLSANRRWLVTPTLGADPQLAKAFFALASQVLQEKL
jgi:sirohydrochlorin ferrochelatase